MIKGLVLFLTLSWGISAYAQQGSPKTSGSPSAAQGAGAAQARAAEWQYSRQTDPLYGNSFDQFVLKGSYLVPPPQSSAEAPMLVVRCSHGKFKGGFLMPGAPVHSAVDYTGHTARSLMGAPQAFVEMRRDSRKKTDNAWWIINDSDTALLFDSAALVKLMTGRLLGHPSDPRQLVHRQIIGVTGITFNRIVMAFDMPADTTRIVEACGLEWGKEKKKLEKRKDARGAHE